MLKKERHSEKRKAKTHYIYCYVGKRKNILFYVSFRPSDKGWLEASETVWEVNTKIAVYCYIKLSSYLTEKRETLRKKKGEDALHLLLRWKTEKYIAV
jgi:hypothetical protein